MCIRDSTQGLYFDTGGIACVDSNVAAVDHRRATFAARGIDAKRSTPIRGGNDIATRIGQLTKHASGRTDRRRIGDRHRIGALRFDPGGPGITLSPIHI